jgi:hypothetical protein
MRTLLTAGLSALAMAAGAPAAAAACKFGPQELSGAIRAESLDDTRFFTSDGRGPITLTVRSEDRALLVDVPGHCEPRYARTVACTAEAVEDEEVYAEIYNPHDAPVEYRFICAE